MVGNTGSGRIIIIFLYLHKCVVEKNGVFGERCGGTLPTAGMEDMDNGTRLGWQTLLC